MKASYMITDQDIQIQIYYCNNAEQRHTTQQEGDARPYIRSGRIIFMDVRLLEALPLSQM